MTLETALPVNGTECTSYSTVDVVQHKCGSSCGDKCPIFKDFLWLRLRLRPRLLHVMGPILIAFESWRQLQLRLLEVLLLVSE